MAINFSRMKAAITHKMQFSTMVEEALNLCSYNALRYKSLAPIAIYLYLSKKSELTAQIIGENFLIAFLALTAQVSFRNNDSVKAGY